MPVLVPSVNQIDAHHAKSTGVDRVGRGVPAFPGEQGSAEGVRGVGVEGAEPAELVPRGGEVAESGLRDDKGDPGLNERDVVGK
jgi:hypothetical protein